MSVGKLIVGICDDDTRELSQANQATRAYFSACGRDVEIHAFDNPLDFVDSLAENSYSLALLDVCMPGLTGIDVAKEIRQSRTECGVIFLTTSREYAVDAFSVDAMNYLLKPYSAHSLNEALDKAFLRIDSQDKFIVKKIDGVLRRISVDKIAVIESDKHYVELIMADGEVCRIRESIEEISDDLAQFGCFVRTHKSYIVNMGHIASVSADSLNVRNREVPISKGRYGTFRDEYMKFAFGK